MKPYTSSNFEKSDKENKHPVSIDLMFKSRQRRAILKSRFMVNRAIGHIHEILGILARDQ